MTKIDPQKMMAQLGQMQKQMEVAQEELKTQFVEHSAGGGAVTVKASGALEIVEITIKPEAIDPDDAEMLQDLLVSAVNGAISAAQALQQQRMMSGMGGLGGSESRHVARARSCVRTVSRQPDHPARAAARDRPAECPEAGVPPAQGDSRRGRRPGRRDHRGEGADRLLRALLQPGRGAAVHDLRRHPRATSR